MIPFVDNFIKSFFPNYTVNSSIENDEFFKAEIEASSFVSNEASIIENAFNFLQPRDSLNLVIIFGEADPISYDSSSGDFAQFVINLKTEYAHQTDEPIKAVITIYKKKESHIITIYDLNIFTSSLAKFSVTEVLSIFDRAFSKNQALNFEVLNLDKAFNTATLFFNPVGIPYTQTTLDRLKCIENLSSSSYFTSIEEHCLTPDDFKLLSSNAIYAALNALFDHYSTILSVIYLFDITSIKDNELEFKINGYKSIKGAINLSKYPILNSEEYYDIYQWVYNGGNLNDKIGLARNIISLHFQKSGELSLSGSPFQSIKSSYKVYEKQNVKQYIEIRNKISDQLIDFNNRANKIIETFASGFQRSALAIITFYTSAIVLKVLGKGDGEFRNVFTLDATVLSIAFLFCSILYYYVSRWEVLQQRERFINSYNNLKERYTDLLDAEDIDRILNKDKEFKQDLNFINAKLKIFSRMWWAIVLILLFFTLFLFLSYNICQLKDIPLFRIIFENRCACL